MDNTTTTQTTVAWEMARIAMCLEAGETAEALAIAEEAFERRVFGPRELRRAEALIGA